jgi:hypothetical protein
VNQGDLYKKVMAHIKEAQKVLMADLLRKLLKRDPLPEDAKRLELNLANKDVDLIIYHVSFDNTFIGHLYVEITEETGNVTFKPAGTFKETLK